MLTARWRAAANPKAFRGRLVRCWGEVSPHACGGTLEMLAPRLLISATVCTTCTSPSSPGRFEVEHYLCFRCKLFVLAEEIKNAAEEEEFQRFHVCYRTRRE